MLNGSSQNGEVFVVDDDPMVLNALTVFLTREGYQVAGFSDGASFLEAARSRTPICIILDVQMPGQTGIDLLKDLKAQDYPAPVFIVSGSGDIPTAVEAIKNGAFDFIEKPVKASTVVTRVREAVDAWSRRNSNGNLPHAFPGHEQLTARERDVLAQIAAGSSNKQAGRELGISPRTIEVHRARIMEKLGARNAADLMRIVLT
jgi:two-component system response regulator FixJ